MTLLTLRAAACSLLVSIAGVAQTPTLLRDFDATPEPFPRSSAALPVATLANGDVLLVASRSGVGRELFRSDGTVAGTTLVRDCLPGYRGGSPEQVVELPGGFVLFTAETVEHGRELWKSDGTTAGTHLLADIRPGSFGSSPLELTRIGARAVFFADDGVHGIEPWVTDGTAAGTRLLVDTNPSGSMSDGTSRVCPIGSAGECLFTAVRSDPTEWSFWRSDLTPGGTRRVVDLPTARYSAGPQQLTPLGGRVVYRGLDGRGLAMLSVTDGTASGTRSLRQASTGGVQRAGSDVFFRGLDNELWATNGTVLGTRQVVDLSPGVLGYSYPVFVGELGGELVFSSRYGSTDRDLFVSDGTAAGTRRIGTAGPYAAEGDGVGTRVGNSLWFTSFEANGPAVYRTDGTASGTMQVGSLEGAGFIGFGNRVVFGGKDASRNEELWISDGSAAGTRLLIDLTPTRGTVGSELQLMTTLRDTVVVRHEERPRVHRLWTTDGRVGGTAPLTSFQDTEILQVCSDDARLLIRVRGPRVIEPLHVSDGTSAGTRSLPLVANLGNFTVGEMTALGTGGFVFRGDALGLGAEPWFTDGTVAGTRLLRDIAPNSASSNPGLFRPFGDRVVFLASTPTSGTEPWISDGTRAGTFQLADMQPGTAGLSGLEVAEAGGKLYLAPRRFGSAETELWVYAGSSAGGATRLDLVPGPGGVDPTGLAALGQRLLFVRQDGGVRRLAITDGTVAGTRTLTGALDIQATLSASRTRALFSVRRGGALSLWTTDGTVAGTREVGAVPLDFPAAVDARYPTDDAVVFRSFDPVSGRELFVSDGTATGTRLLVDLGLENADPGPVMRAGTRLVTVADDGIHGRELHGFELSLVGDETIDRVGFGCAGSGGIVPQLRVDGEPDASDPAGFAVVLEGTPASVPVALVIGTESAVFWNAGCVQWVGGVAVALAASSNAAGQARFQLSPFSALGGLQLVTQGYAVDPDGAWRGLASSTPGLTIVLGR